MPSFTASLLSGAGSTTLPIFGLVGNGSKAVFVREIGIFNTTVNALDLTICRISTAGTPGSSATAMATSDPTASATATLKGTYSSTAPTTAITGKRRQFAGVVGDGVIWTFPNGLMIPATANAGIGAIVSTGTGQACTVYVDWDE